MNMAKVGIRIPNTTNLPRNEVVYTTVPFATGEWFGHEPLVMVDESGNKVDAYLEPLGAKRQDGSYRYGKLLSRVQLEPNETKYYTLSNGTPDKPAPFEFNSKIFSNGNPGSLLLTIKRGDKVLTCNFSENVRLIEDNRMRKVFESRVRLEDFVVDFKLYIMSQQELMKFELSIAGSNPSNTAYTYSFDEIRLAAIGNAFVNIRGLEKRGVKPVTLYKDYQLMSADYFGDGQKQSWYGELVPALDINDLPALAAALAFIQQPLYGMSTSWNTKDAYAAFGTIQQPNKVSTTEMWSQTTNQYRSFDSFIRSQGTPWDDYLLGVTKTPGQTGSQVDFGCLEGGPILYLGAAELLDMVLFLATEETKRPGHYYEMDGRSVKSSSHPNWIVWDGRTHWSVGVSPDRLGKTAPDFGGHFHGWLGKDWEHHSSNLLSLAALLTGSYLLLDEVNNEVELYLAGHTLPSTKPGWATNGRGAPRGFGRTHHAMANHYVLTNRSDLVERMIARFKECVVGTWDGAIRSPVRNWMHLRDDRVLGRTIDAWVPWNESLGLMGAVALWNVTKEQSVKDFIVAWGNTILNYGWRPSYVDGNLAYVGIGQGVEWFDSGRALTSEEYWNGRSFIDAGGLSLWGLPVLKVIAENPSVFGPDSAAKAASYLGVVVKTTSLPFDDFGKWTAIKMQ
jgi:hypothetical protein